MILGLDGFRALACLAVFYYDIFGGFGYLGVPAFFVLSGFLITTILVRMKASRGRRAYFIDFYGRRSARIFPLYFAYLGLASVAVALSGEPGEISSFFGEQLPCALSYTVNFMGAGDSWSTAESARFVAHLWSLSVEEQFYLVWPVFIYVVPNERLGRALIAVIAVGPLLRLTQYAWMLHHPGGWNPEWDLAIYVLTSSHLDAFATGGYFALFAGNRRYTMQHVLWMAAGIVIVGYVTELMTTGSVFWSALGYAPYMKDSGKFVWGYSAINVLFATILVAISQRAFLPGLLENKWLSRLGKVSYGLYVFDAATIWLVRQHLPHGSRLLHAAIALPISIAVSAASYLLFERHFLVFKDRYFAHSKVRRPPPQSP